jgi:tetratricopeptide (TPR) repeat protein
VKNSKQKNQYTGKYYFVVLAMAAVMGGLTLFFFSGVIKWIFLTLIVFASAGAGIKEGLKGVCWLVLVCGIFYLIFWFFESPEYRAGYTAYEKGDYVTAIDNLDLAIKTHPEKGNGYLLRCKAKLKSGQTHAALPDCNLAIMLKYERKEESYAARARVHKKLDMLEQAVADFTVALKHVNWDSSESKWYLLYERGLVNEQLERSDYAISDLLAAIELNEDWYAAWWPLGNSYFKKGKLILSLSAYEHYRESHDPNVDPFPESLNKRMAYLREAINQQK